MGFNERIQQALAPAIKQMQDQIEKTAEQRKKMLMSNINNMLNEFNLLTERVDALEMKLCKLEDRNASVGGDN